MPDVEDVLQETLTVFARRFASVDASAHRAFLVSTARRIAADVRRSRWHRTPFLPLDGDIDLAELPAPEEGIDSQRAHARALEALGVMNPQERDLFIEARWAGRPRHLLARKHRLAPGTVASRLARADASFQSLLHRIGLQEQEQRRQGLAWWPWSAPGRLSPGVRAHTPPWATIEHRGWQFINNQWARARARGRFEQCLLEQDYPQKRVGWSWNWPPGSLGPYGFPQAQAGWSPWLGGPSSHPRFPLELQRTGRLLLDFDVESDIKGAHVLLVLVFLTSSPTVKAGVDPTLIDSELALLLDVVPDQLPVTVTARPWLGDASYDVWRETRWGGRDLSGFASYVMRRRPSTRRGVIDLRLLLTYLEQQGLIAPNLWVASVGFGNEIWGGLGTTWVQRLELSVA